MSQVTYVGGAPTGSGSSIIADLTTKTGSAPSSNSLIPFSETSGSGEFLVGQACSQLVDGVITHAPLGGINAILPAGLIAKISSGVGEYQTAGPITLTTLEWDAVTGGSGGLTPSATYYVSQDSFGNPITTNPNGAQIGHALSATTMLVQIAPAPIAMGTYQAVNGSGGSILQCEAVTAAIVDLPATVNLCPADGSQFAGLSQGNVLNGASGIFQMGGLFTATVAAWHAAGAAIGGLSPGAYYFVDQTTPGKITSTPPGSGDFSAVIGLAIDAITMMILPSPAILLP